MKIAEVVATFPPHHGGMGYVCYHNARELAERGHDVTVFCLDHRTFPDFDRKQPFRTERLRSPLILGDGGVVPHLLMGLRRCDVVHLHYPFYGGAEYVYLASRLAGRRYLMTYHMDVFGTTPLKRLIIDGYERLLTRRIVDGAACIAALSREHLASSKISGIVDMRKVIELPNGVDAERFAPRPKDPELVKRYGLAGKTVVLFVGNLQPFKGLHLLIDAVAGLHDPDVVLLIVGGGYAEREFRKSVADRGIGARVVFAGPQAPDRDLPAHYNLGDFLVLPSTHSESFGLVVLEALASGIPAIVSSLPGPAQLIQNGTDGFIAEKGDVEDLKAKIILLLNKDRERASMGEAGRQKILNRYDWKVIGGRLENVLRSMAGA